MRKLVALLLIAALAMALCCCTGGDTTYKSDEIQFSAVESGDYIVAFDTSKGTFKAVLYAEYAPKSVENFAALAGSGFYDGMEFHRVIENLLIQSGDPTDTGTGGSSASGEAVPNEFCNELHNFKGALGMATNDNGDNLSQFYIVTGGPIDGAVAEKLTASGYSDSVVKVYKEWGGAPHLDFRYTVFGQVYEGFDVLEKICSVKVDSFNRPQKKVILNSVKVEIAP